MINIGDMDFLMGDFFFLAQAYYSHANKIHLNLLHGRWFGCDVCQKYFPNKPVLESHKSTVHSKFDTVRLNCLRLLSKKYQIFTK